MKKILIIIMILLLLPIPVSAAAFTAPEVQGEAREYLPEQSESFGQDLLKILTSALQKIRPGIAEALQTCLSVICIVILVSLLHSFQGNMKRITGLAGAVLAGILLLQSANTLIRLGTSTVTQLSEYGRLLLPVLTAALAAQGGTASSAALYTGTMVFNTVLTGAIEKVIVPMLYIYLCLSIANSALANEALEKLRSLAKWLMTWSLKIIIYIFTGYISITGVVSGTVDSTAIKAAKLAISGSVPVVGNIVSDASEAILVSAGIMKNAAGVYGALAIIAILIGPFIKIGVQYLMLKATAAVCGIFGDKNINTLVSDFSGTMGILLAMTGVVCLMLLISIVCFMRGIT